MVDLVRRPNGRPFEFRAEKENEETEKVRMDSDLVCVLELLRHISD